MPIHALDAIDDALGPTRTLVGRLGVGGWLKLGGVTLLVGGFGSASFSANVPGELLGVLPDVLPYEGDAAGATLRVGAVVVAGLALAGFLLVRSLLEFALYEAMRDGDVTVRRAVRRWWHQALQLWALRVALAWGLLGGGVALAAAAVAGQVSLPAVGADALPVVTVAATFGAYALLGGLTTRFVVPVMMATGGGIGDSWARFLRVVAASPGQYGWYLVVGLVVRFAADVLALSTALLVSVLLSFQLVVVVVPSVVALGVAPSAPSSLPILALLVALAAMYLLVVLLGAMVARLPFVVYVRNYALAVLRGTEPSLDPIA